MAVQTKQYKSISQLIIATDHTAAPVSLTINNAAGYAVGATSIIVSAATFANNDVVRFGEGEDTEVQTITAGGGTATVTISPGLRRARAHLDPVVKLQADQYGPVSDAGVKVEWSRESTDQPIASQRLPFAVVRGNGAMTVEFALAAPTLHSIALALGVGRSGVQGAAGTTADPFHIITNGSDFGTLNNASVVVNGTLNDGTNFRVEGYGLAFDYTGLQIALTRGTPALVPVKLLCGGGGIVSEAAPLWTGTTTYVATDGDVLDGLVDAGVFADTGTTSSSSTASNAGTKVINVTSGGASFTTNSWLRIPNPLGDEFHQVESSTGTTITVRTFLKNTIAASAALAITLQTLTSFASLTAAGVTFEVGGTVTRVLTALREMAVGQRAGAATVTMSCAVQQMSKANLARALGKADPGGADLVTFDGLGSVKIKGFFTKGLLQNGKTIWANAWGSNADLSAVALTLNNAGDPPAAPIRLKPSSAVQLIVTP